MSFFEVPNGILKKLDLNRIGIYRYGQLEGSHTSNNYLKEYKQRGLLIITLPLDGIT